MQIQRSHHGNRSQRRPLRNLIDDDGARVPDRGTQSRSGRRVRAILMYTHYSAKLTGPYRRELRALFQTEVADEQRHAQFLADKIAALGGETD